MQLTLPRLETQREAPKIKAENPGMKGKTVQKRLSALYRVRFVLCLARRHASAP
jgi:hypothetical protein